MVRCRYREFGIWFIYQADGICVPDSPSGGSSAPCARLYKRRACRSTITGQSTKPVGAGVRHCLCGSRWSPRNPGWIADGEGNCCDPTNARIGPMAGENRLLRPAQIRSATRLTLRPICSRQFRASLVRTAGLTASPGSGVGSSRSVGIAASHWMAYSLSGIYSPRAVPTKQKRHRSTATCILTRSVPHPTRYRTDPD